MSVLIEVVGPLAGRVFGLVGYWIAEIAVEMGLVSWWNRRRRRKLEQALSGLDATARAAALRERWASAESTGDRAVILEVAGAAPETIDLHLAALDSGDFSLVSITVSVFKKQPELPPELTERAAGLAGSKGWLAGAGRALQRGRAIGSA